MRYEPMVSEPERKTKKIAFCLHGIVGGVGGKYGEGDSLESLELGYKHYKKYILDINDCDVFCHTATLERSEDIINLYNPVSYKFLKQPNFPSPPNSGPIFTGGNNTRIQAHYHKWFSHKQVSDLRKEYEKETGVKYDMVYIGRYDLAWNTIVDFSKFDRNKFWLGNWNRPFITGSNIFGKNTGDWIEERVWFRKRKEHNLPFISNNELSEKDTGIELRLNGWPHNTKPYTPNHGSEGVIDSWAFSKPEYMDMYCELYDKMDEYMTRDPNTWSGGTIHDHTGGISNHRLIPCHLEEMGLLDKLDFAFYFLDEFPTVRRRYYAI